MSKAIAILGPTASGKTRLALDIANQLPVEIISLDSALIYQDMDIGTAKPSAEELAAVPHHLVNIISPLEAYSAADFVADTVRLTDEIIARGRIPLIVGGTMMYHHALTQGLNTLPSADPTIRQQLAEEKAQYGLAALYQRLSTIDPATAARLQPQDSQRIERALEVYLLTGKPLSVHFAEQSQQQSSINLTTLALIPEDRHRLHDAIADRFYAMLRAGLIDEVDSLQQRYPALHADLPSMRCVGYRQTWQYLAGEYDYNTLAEKGIVATRQLAKRQLTWLRKIEHDQVFDPYTSSPTTLTQTAISLITQHMNT